MKKKIKFLLVLIGIPLSCTYLAQPNAGIKPNVRHDHLSRTQTITIKILMRNICSTIDKIMQAHPSAIDTLQRCTLVLLVSKYLGSIRQHNNVDYRFNSDSLSTLYFDEFSKYTKYHNTFFDYITKVSNENYYNDNQINNLLSFAVFSKSHTMVSEFITFLEQLGIQLDINAKDLFGMSILNYAIASGHKEMVQVLIKLAPFLHIYGKENAFDFPNLLPHAISIGDKESVKILIDSGADPNALYDSQRMLIHGNALMLTEVYDQKEVADYLIEHNSIENLDQQDMYGQTVLMRIASTRYAKWSKILYTLLQKADITTTDLDGQNVLMHLLNRYTDIYRKYYHSVDEFIGGYNYSPDNDQPKAEAAKCIFEDVCQDKKKMLKDLLSHSHLPQIMHSKDKKRKTILTYFKQLLSAMPEVGQQQEIVEMLINAKMYDIATHLRLSN